MVRRCFFARYWSVSTGSGLSPQTQGFLHSSASSVPYAFRGRCGVSLCCAYVVLLVKLSEPGVSKLVEASREVYGRTLPFSQLPLSFANLIDRLAANAITTTTAAVLTLVLVHCASCTLCFLSNCEALPLHLVGIPLLLNQ
jgi:hypothetical protein